MSRIRGKRAMKVWDLIKAPDQAFELETVAGMSGGHRRIREITVNRPGLALAGFFHYFANKRVQVMGSAESSYLKSLAPHVRYERIRGLFSQHIPCLIYARNLRPDPEVIQLAEQSRTPLLRSPLITMDLINRLTLYLERQSAPRALIQAGMIDIQGFGVLIRGRSGIGKSECMLSLLKRGHSLVSDDVTHVTLFFTSGRPELIGTSAEMTRFQMEVRGLGIINVPAVFGISSVRVEKRIDMAVTLKDWEPGEDVERVGLTQDYYEIMGNKVPHITLPVAPGRDVSQLVEVAALDQKLRTLGFHAALEFDKRVREALTQNNPGRE